LCPTLPGGRPDRVRVDLLGAGLILTGRAPCEGLTIAAALWEIAAIRVAAGAG
jgi:putative Mg2+ transporter-C (MgtC) family protein